MVNQQENDPERGLEEAVEEQQEQRDFVYEQGEGVGAASREEPGEMTLVNKEYVKQWEQNAREGDEEAQESWKTFVNTYKSAKERLEKLQAGEENVPKLTDNQKRWLRVWDAKQTEEAFSDEDREVWEELSQKSEDEMSLAEKRVHEELNAKLKESLSKEPDTSFLEQVGEDDGEDEDGEDAIPMKNGKEVKVWQGPETEIEDAEDGESEPADESDEVIDADFRELNEEPEVPNEEAPPRETREQKIEKEKNAMSMLEKVRNAEIFGQPLGTFLAGAGVGAAVRFATESIMPGFGGAAAGATVGGFRNYMRQRQEFNDYASSLEGMGMSDLGAHLSQLKESLGNSDNPKIQEGIYDEIRFTMVAIREKEANMDLEAKVDMMMGDGSFFEGDLREKRETHASLMEAIKKAGKTDMKELGGAILRGAAFGAVGGYLGGWLVEKAGHAGLIPVPGLVPESAQDHVPDTGQTPDAETTPDSEATPDTGAEDTAEPEPETEPEPEQQEPEADIEPEPEQVPEQPEGAPEGSEQTPAQESIAEVFPETHALESGQNPWTVTESYLHELDPERNWTDEEVMNVVKSLAADSDISVPEWGIEGSVDHRQLPVGFELQYGEETRNALNSIVGADQNAPVESPVETPVSPDVPETPEVTETPQATETPVEEGGDTSQEPTPGPTVVPDESAGEAEPTPSGEGSQAESLPPEIAGLPNEVTIEGDTTPYDATSQYLENAFGREPTNQEVIRVSGLVFETMARESGREETAFSGMAWLSQSADSMDEDLRNLTFTPEVKKIIADMK